MRLLLADEHAIVREGLCALLASQPDIEVVGQAADGQHAVLAAVQLAPDVVLMSTELPGMTGIEAARAIREEATRTKVLMLSVHRGSQMVLDALRAGASGYILKTNTAEECLEAVRTVASGRTYLSPDVAGLVRDDCVARQPCGGSPRRALLSSRECEVLALIADGYSSKEIARKLYLSPRTVEKHRGCLMEKIGLRGIAELTKYAVREGMTTL